MSRMPPPLDFETRASLLAEQNVDLCRLAAIAVAKRLRSNWRPDELLGFTWPHLVQAARKWDARLPFRVYALRILCFRIIDDLRTETGHRRRRPKPVFVPIPAADLPEVGRPAEPGQGEILALCARLLPARLGHLMCLVYRDGLTQAQAGAALGVGCSRASQMHSDAIRRIRRMLESGVIR